MLSPFTPAAVDLRDRVSDFMASEVLPNVGRYRAELEQNHAAGRPYKRLELIEVLKARARSAGLWNLFLPGDTAQA